MAFGTNGHGARVEEAPAAVRLTDRLENNPALDRPVSAMRPVADALVANRAVADLLHGTWLGHALHPPMTDLPIGCWVSTNLLDLVGGEQSRPAAQRLLTIGIVSALPTAVTGLAEWADAGQREKRTGVVHASANSVGLVCYLASLRARRRSRHLRGALWALAGTAASGVGAYLGGHLVSARKVSSRHPLFEDTPS